MLARPFSPILAGMMALLIDAASLGSTAVQTWKQTWTGETAGNALAPVAARELADHSTMVVAYAGNLAAIRYDHDGNLLSAASIASPYFSLVTSNPLGTSQASLVTIDPFGGVFVASTSHISSSQGDVWLMKYDGLTGKPRWQAPAIYSIGKFRKVVPLRLLIDPAGDALIVTDGTRCSNTTASRELHSGEVRSRSPTPGSRPHPSIRPAT